MIDQIVAPQIGKGSLFKSFDKTLEVPASLVCQFRPLEPAFDLQDLEASLPL